MTLLTYKINIYSVIGTFPQESEKTENYQEIKFAKCFLSKKHTPHLLLIFQHIKEISIM